MSNYHVRQMQENKKMVKIVFHIPIPGGGTNQAGISWQAAVVLDQGGQDAIETVLPEIQGTAEETSMKAGELVEVQEWLRFSSTNLTNAQRKAEIEARYMELAADLIVEKQITLSFIGLADDVS